MRPMIRNLIAVLGMAALLTAGAALTTTATATADGCIQTNHVHC